MKTVRYSLFLVLFILLGMELQAQGYTAPSRDRVEALLGVVNDCKENLERQEQELKTMEADPENVTLARYNATKDAIEAYKACLKLARKELESLRKKYPGWFNSPSASMEATVHRQIIIVTPVILLALIPDMESLLKAIVTRFNAIEQPGH